MLLELKVSQFAIINELHIHFRDGLNILSGETGAGKSVLLKSLSLLMGGKASSSDIRTGCKQAIIEGRFDIRKRKDLQKRLEEMGVDVDEEFLVVKRIVSGERSRIYLNGSMTTLAELRAIVAPLIEVTGPSAPLIEMTGQHENRSLLSTGYHLNLLDRYTGAWEKRRQYKKDFQSYQELKEQLSSFEERSREQAQRLDFLIFQRDEIAGLELTPGEDQEIETKVSRLRNANRLMRFVEEARSLLYEGDNSAVSQLYSVLHMTDDIRALDPELASKTEAIEGLASQLQDIAYELRDYASSTDLDPDSLESFEERLTEIKKLKRKYGATVDDILAAYEQIENEINEIEGSDNKLEQIRDEIKKLEKSLTKQAQDLHKTRAQGSSLLADSVNAELNDLNMKGVHFEVQVEKLEELGPNGFSHVEFMIQPSAKEPLRPIAKIASGGELSRILLSLKRVIGENTHPRTYLFDEVDTGVSGPTAEKVGRKLHTIAQGQQVICVTHLPQVAAFGDHHFYIEKKAGGKSVTQMTIVELDKDSRVNEIARLISGEKITKTSLAHAQQLLAH